MHIHKQNPMQWPSKTTLS